jgi:hypothetical protein
VEIIKKKKRWPKAMELGVLMAYKERRLGGAMRWLFFPRSISI